MTGKYKITINDIFERPAKWVQREHTEFTSNEQNAGIFSAMEVISIIANELKETSRYLTKIEIINL